MKLEIISATVAINSAVIETFQQTQNICIKFIQRRPNVCQPNVFDVQNFRQGGSGGGLGSGPPSQHHRGR